MKPGQENDDQQQKGPIRFGIMSNDDKFSQWQVKCIRQLLDLDFTKPSAFILMEDPNAKENDIFFFEGGFSGKEEESPFLYRGYKRRRLKSFLGRENSIPSGLKGVETIRCTTKLVDGGYHSLLEPDMKKITGLDLDFVMNFDHRPIKGEILDKVRFGIWAFQYYDLNRFRGTPPCFWDIFHGHSVTAAILKRLTDNVNEQIVLRKGYFETILHSYPRSFNRVLDETTAWPAEVARDLHNNIDHYFKNKQKFPSTPVYELPTNSQFLHFYLKQSANYFRMVNRTRLHRDIWNIGMVDEPIHRFLEKDFKPEIRWLPIPSNDSFRADPFGMDLDGELHVLFESFDYERPKGRISRIKVSEKEFGKEHDGILDGATHFSYPYLLNHKGKVYCVPETASDNRVDLYESDPFPTKWKKVATLIKDIPAVDSSIFQYDDMWWMTFTDARKGSALRLYIWYSDELTSGWKPHKSNPVKTDLRSTRPAGTPFIHNGDLYRPAQDCSVTYGKRVVINKVKRITRKIFEEEPSAFVEPIQDGPYPDGVHTISAVDNRTLIDGKRIVFGRPAPD